MRENAEMRSLDALLRVICLSLQRRCAGARLGWRGRRIPGARKGSRGRRGGERNRGSSAESAQASRRHCQLNAKTQIPPDLVVKYQVIDIAEVISSLIWRRNIVQTSCQNRTLNLSLRHEVARLIVWHVVTRPVVPSAVSYADVREGNAPYKACGHGTHNHPIGTRTVRGECICQHQAEMGLDGWYGEHT